MALESVLRSVLKGKSALGDSEEYTEEFLDSMYILQHCFLCTYMYTVVCDCLCINTAYVDTDLSRLLYYLHSTYSGTLLERTQLK